MLGRLLTIVSTCQGLACERVVGNESNRKCRFKRPRTVFCGGIPVSRRVCLQTLTPFWPVVVIIISEAASGFSAFLLFLPPWLDKTFGSEYVRKPAGDDSRLRARGVFNSLFQM